MTGTQNERQNYGSGRCVCVGRGGGRLEKLKDIGLNFIESINGDIVVDGKGLNKVSVYVDRCACFSLSLDQLISWRDVAS